MASSRPTAEHAVRIGQIFLGKYRVEGILGQGGMGVVAECTHLQLNERVAIKMLRPDVLLDEEAVERFMREAQAAVKLKSEYVAKVTDVGALESGTPYMVMEFLEGTDLGALIVERGHIPVPWATELVLQTAEALAEAHSIGIVHRDIKPANLFVTWRPDGTSLIKVLDFGISKSPMGTDMQLTQTQSLLGTPAYMSPEQMRSARLVDARTDMWSLGTVLYEMLEGRKPFEAESFSEMCVKVSIDPPARMRNVPPALEAVIMRCLAKSPEQRYASMAELGRELVPFAQDQQQGSVMVERMHRMLRRGEAAMKAPSVWDVASNPAMRAFHPAHDRTPIPAAQPTERSAPAYAITEAQLATAPIQVPSSRTKKTGLALGVLGAFAVGSIVFVLASRETVPAKPVVDQPAPVTMPAAAKEETPVPPVPPKVEEKLPPVEAPRAPTEPAIVKKPIKQTKTVAKKQPVTKQPEGVPEVKPVQPKSAGCDVWENAHGCDKKKK